MRRSVDFSEDDDAGLGHELFFDDRRDETVRRYGCAVAHVGGVRVGCVDNWILDAGDYSSLWEAVGNLRAGQQIDVRPAIDNPAQTEYYIIED